MNSPLFPTITDDAQVLRVSYKEPEADVVNPVATTSVPLTAVAAKPSRLSINILSAHIADAQLVGSATEAEDIVLGLVPAREVAIGNPDHPHRMNAVVIDINRCSNLIASRTRRGTGNVVLMSQKLLDALVEANVMGLTVSQSETVGRWTKKAVVNGVMDVYVGDSIAEDEVYVAYVGHSQLIDGPAGLIVSGTDQYLYLLPNTTTSLANAEDYVQRLKITDL